jgi:hypothetical protein
LGDRCHGAVSRHQRPEQFRSEFGVVRRPAARTSGRSAGPRQCRDLFAPHDLDLDQTGTSLDLKGKIRFGTASAAQGLGTGRNDYALSLEFDQRLPGGASLFASFGRSFPVSTPDLALRQV